MKFFLSFQSKILTNYGIIPTRENYAAQIDVMPTEQREKDTKYLYRGKYIFY
jgi:hypothetical protein